MHYLEKELYQLLQKDNKIFEFIQESSLDGMWYWDLENPKNEWMSPRFWEVLGYSAKEKAHLTSSWQDIIFSEDLNLALENFNKHCEDPSYPYDQIVRYKHKTGKTVYIRCRGTVVRDTKGKPIRMIGAHNDYSDIMNHKIKLDAILNSSLDGIITFDSFKNNENEIIDFVFTFANERACEIVSHKEKELLGRRLSVMIPGNFVPLDSLNGNSLFNIYKNIVLSKQAESFEFYFAHDGIKEWFRVKAVPYETGFIVTFTVITKEKELEAQSILTSKGLMLEAISHQWRQPLAQINSIIFKLEHLLETDLNNKNLFLNEVKKIETITRFLSNTLEDFHDSLFQDTKKEIFSLQTIIDNIIELFDLSLARNNITLEKQTDKQNVIIKSYPNHLTHVLFCIIQNSIDAFKTISEEKTIIVNYEMQKNYIKISLRDNAGGIKEDVLLKLLHSSYSTKKDGRGLGLYLSNLIVTKLLEGEMKIFNSSDGTQVDLKFKRDVDE